MNRIELLAPAGNALVGRAAIDAGADAVYIGAARFGAREKAANSTEDIEELCSHARKFGARVYVTVNTLIAENELEACRRLICSLAEAGADGIIIQDPGILEMDLPPIKLIASTQMNCGSADKISFFHSIGIKRFILPRELSLSEIKAIRQAVPASVELEAFVHGALCVARSGECYLSWHIGGRSGNRGCCAQPCRNLYTLRDTEGNVIERDRHLLSLRDLDLHNRLAELMEAGISSFKIEGRLKGQDYVVNTVAFYRAAIDKVLEEKGGEKSSRGFSVPDRAFEPCPEKTFNRGFSEYMLDGRKAGVSAMDTPSMKGELLGIVKKVRGKRVFLDRKVSVSNGDGMAFVTASGLKGTNINIQESPDSVTVNDSRAIKPGMTVYRNYDAAWHRTIPVFARYIPITVSAEEAEGAIVFLAEDTEGNRYSITADDLTEPARDPEKALDNLKKQLGKKCEDSYLACTGVTLRLKQVPFVPISRINELRRQLHKGLMSLRQDKRRETGSLIIRSEIPYITNTLDYRANIANSLARAFYERHGVRTIEAAPESRRGEGMKGRQVMECRYCIRRELGLCSSDKTENKPLVLENDTVRLKAVFDCAGCTMRLYAVK